jgi:hypothetical protein
MIRDGVQPIDVASVVKEIRHARNFMVQTFVQYAFIFRTVLDYLRDNLHVVAAEVKRRQALQPEPEPEPEPVVSVAEPVAEPVAPLLATEPVEQRTFVASGTATISRKALQQVSAGVHTVILDAMQLFVVEIRIGLQTICVCVLGGGGSRQR